jgi:hypothetical protein
MKELHLVLVISSWVSEKNSGLNPDCHATEFFLVDTENPKARWFVKTFLIPEEFINLAQSFGPTDKISTFKQKVQELIRTNKEYRICLSTISV